MNTSNLDVFPDEAQCDAFFASLKPHNGASTMRMSRLASGPSLADDLGDVALMSTESPVVLAFADGLSADKREMAMNAALFAEVYANDSHDRDSAAVAWMKAYREAMLQAGWFMGSTDSETYTANSMNLTMDSVVLDIVASVAGANAAALLPLISKTFEKIHARQELITLFDKNSTTATKNSCRILPCLESENGMAVSLFIGLEFEKSDLEGGSLFWKWKKHNLEIQKVATMVNWNMDRYKRNEEKILRYLDRDSDDFFAKIM
ncbi:hypothetical protein G3435_11370 [Pseudomonas sp. MAFF212428]|uniref:Uncharacterized protein n=1 Tax=Pseudomonas brassicae TaxID=2708063 RepID=A0A6B3NVQ9_9PSED|nr:hypothetical protein [Pseudomonas brassicae]NER60424.1 hypothetical protein [Pseudomonas brassicae]NER66229.1 hypothetical protein [Pseudomonas brassicae]